MIRQAVILAAGMGSRIRAGGNDLPKPLHTIGGQSLIKRTILTLADAGITRVGVIIGFRGELIAKAIEEDGDYTRLGITVELIENADYEKANGVSVLAAAPYFSEPFLLSMADHVYDSSIPAQAAAADMNEGDLYLCVDPRLEDVYDMDDATKVKTKDGVIVEIGKTIPEYDCVDCGVFAISPALLAELQSVLDAKGDCSLSDGVQSLSAKGRARVLPIGEKAFWQDVDTPDARERAEGILGADSKVVPAALTSEDRASASGTWTRN